MNFNVKEFISHTANKAGDENLLRNHLTSVAKRAKEYSIPLCMEEEAEVCGLLHDLGKYGRLFQRRLKGLERGIDHWSIGAWAALQKYHEQGLASALAIQGHHIGLQKFSSDALRLLEPEKLFENHPDNLRLSEKDLEKLLQLLRQDGIHLPERINQSVLQSGRAHVESAASMLDVRMLFSVLVDSDFIETEAHFNSDISGSMKHRDQGSKLEAEKALDILEVRIASLKKSSKSSDDIYKLRQDLLSTCLESSEEPTGLFTLSAPTGSGKTLSMLSFALRHCWKHNLRRVILVIPYLSIIEQTARVLHDTFDPYFGSKYILEDHSLANSIDDSTRDDYDLFRARAMLAENWDAPVIITTSVKFLESLHSNKPSACRKLHRLAESVIIFDEVQNLPLSIAIPTLATLSHLSRSYRSTVVFSTATQPAFDHLHEKVESLASSGWKPTDIVPAESKLFKRADRTQVILMNDLNPISWDEIADRLDSHDQVLCITNLKRHASELYDRLVDHANCYHLSTNMCPIHRQDTLKAVYNALNESQSCSLISTQCVEAGVDIDFPVVYRAFGPLEAIAQAAGRCNRHGNREIGEVNIFVPEDKRQYPNGAYEQAANVTSMIIKELEIDSIEISDHELFKKYYRTLYDFARPADQQEELRSAIQMLDFKKTSESYKVIDNYSINILVPYKIDIYNQLKEEVASEGLSRRWIRRAMLHSISIYKPNSDDPIWSYLDPIHLRSYGIKQDLTADNWYIYLEPEHYDARKGLIPPSSWETIIA